MNSKSARSEVIRRAPLRARREGDEDVEVQIP